MATIEPYQLADGAKRYRVRYRTPDRRSTDKSGFTTRRDARAFANTIETAKLTGTFVPHAAGRATVADLARQWFAGSGRIKATTTAARQSAWDHRVGARWANTPIGDIRPSQVRAWVAELAAEGVGAASIEAALLVLRGALDVAVQDNGLAVNPAAGVKAPRRMHTRRGYLTIGQLQALAGEMDRSQSATAVLFLGLTGLRWGEMAALKVSSFDMLRRRVNVTEAVAEVRGRLVVSTPKTHARRSVPFPRVLADRLAELMAGKGRDDLVFTGPEGGAFRVSAFRSKVFAQAVTRVQRFDPSFPTITPHSLRHTAASLAISAGANVKGVQLMLGHGSAAMTLDQYADLFPDDLDQVADRLDQAMRGQNVGVSWVKPG